MQPNTRRPYPVPLKPPSERRRESASLADLSAPVLLTDLFEPAAIEVAYDYALERARAADSYSDGQVDAAAAFYKDPLSQVFLHQCLPRVETRLGVHLLPSYAYLRVHYGGSKLDAHTDREACELTVSLHLGSICEAPWPIHVEVADEVQSFSQHPGSGLAILGQHWPHWRDPFEGTHHAQMYLHYVERDGGFAGLVDDGNPGG